MNKKTEFAAKPSIHPQLQLLLHKIKLAFMIFSCDSRCQRPPARTLWPGNVHLLLPRAVVWNFAPGQGTTGIQRCCFAVPVGWVGHESCFKEGQQNCKSVAKTKSPRQVLSNIGGGSSVGHLSSLSLSLLSLPPHASGSLPSSLSAHFSLTLP